MRRKTGPKFQIQRGNNHAQNKEARHPLVGEVFEAEVTDLNSDGLGVLEHSSGLKVFVPGVCLGEAVSAKITEHRGRWGLGILKQIISPSESRVTPACAFQGFSKGSCGGCTWMHMDYSEQLRIKQNRVENALARIFSSQNQLTDLGFLKEIVASPKSLKYRNRAQFKTDGERFGYMQYGSKDIAEVDDCLILTDKNRQTLTELRNKLPNTAWKIKSALARKKKHWTRIDIDEQCTAETASVNQRLTFKQANGFQNQVIKKWLQKQLSVQDKNEPVLELFAGSGNFTQIASDLGFKSITAIEVVEQAVEDLKRIAGVDAFVCDLFDESNMPTQLAKINPAKILLLDPPRDGFKSKEAFFKLEQSESIEAIFYISCDLATFIRDTEFFLKKGFVCEELQPIDMFPQTPHVELMAHFKK